MLAPLENDYLKVGTPPLCLGRSAHPRGIPSYDHQLFISHALYSLHGTDSLPDCRLFYFRFI